MSCRLRVAALFLVASDLFVEFVGQQVDGRIHVVVDDGRVHVGAGQADRALGRMPQFFNRKRTLHVDDAVAVPQDARDLLFNIAAQRW